MRIGQTETEDNEHRMNKNINKTRTEKDTGLVIDDKLSFSEHLSEKNKQDYKPCLLCW